MKQYLLLVFVLSSFFLRAQKIDSIYVNLYTDSLKKGTFNYINIDGQLSNGHYLPLDSTHLIFKSSAGKFTGNNLWIDQNFAAEKVSIEVILKQNPAIRKSFDIYIKQKPDGPLKTVDEIMSDMKKAKKKKKE